MNVEQVDQRVIDHESRLSKLEGIIEQISLRLGELSDRLDSGLRWMMGLQITTLVALIGILVTILVKLE